MRSATLGSLLGAVVSLIAIVAFLAAGETRAARDTRGYAPLRAVKRPGPAAISAMASPGHVVMKFREGMTVHTAKSRLGDASAARVVNAFTRRGLPEPEAVVTVDPEILRQKRIIAEDRVKTFLPDLSLYFRMPVSDPVLAASLIDELNRLDEIELAYFAPRPEVASRPQEPGSGYQEWLQASTTPNFEGGQLYLNAAPDGVGAASAWTLAGGTGAGVQVMDVEYGWQLTHEDLPGGATAVVIGVNPLDDTDHGTAVLGEMASGRNGYGMTGIAYEADLGVSSVLTMSTADAITQAANASDPGDAILIELHAPGPHYDTARDDQLGYVAMEYWQDNFDAILNAWGQGVIVCEAAGNGSENFDDPMYEGRFDPAFRYSHAIICGAGNPPNAFDNDRSKLGFSNWGQRVDLQGYGTLVYTTGYGDLYSTGGQNFWYTESFGGTSSASPIVTGAVLCMSGAFQQQFGFVPDADTIRNLLISTGSPQQTPFVTRHIGPRPNLHAALEGLFDPVDSVWYGDIVVPTGQTGAVPVRMANSHPVTEFYLPFALSGSAPIAIDSITRGPRTITFEHIQMLINNQGTGKAGAILRADNGGRTMPLPTGDGIVAFLWVHADSGPGNEVDVLDSTTVGISQIHLRLISAFDDGYPDFFDAGSITTDGSCNCLSHGDVSDNGSLEITDVVGVVGVAFRNEPPAITDPACPHATRADYTCDGVINVQDVVRAVDVIFRSGLPICNPCVP